MIQIEVNGNLFDGFESVTVKRTMNSLCGQYSVQAATQTQAFSDFPIKRGNQARIIVDSELWMTCFIEDFDVDYDKDRMTIKFAGRDLTADIVDSSVPPSISFNGPISLENIIQSALRLAGITDITIVNNATDIRDFATEEIVAPDIGTSLIDFFNSYAAKRQVLLLTDSEGNLLITRSSQELGPIELKNVIGDENNIVAASSKFSDRGRFNRYLVLSNGSIAQLSFFGEGVESVSAREAQEIDPAIRSSRLKVIESENPSNNEECRERAIWEANIARTRSLVYSCVVDGHSHDSGPFDINQIARVFDEYAGVDAELLLHTVTLVSDDDSGNTATLDFTTRDAFTLQATADARQNNTNNVGLVWNETNFQ